MLTGLTGCAKVVCLPKIMIMTNKPHNFGTTDDVVQKAPQKPNFRATQTIEAARPFTQILAESETVKRAGHAPDAPPEPDSNSVLTPEQISAAVRAAMDLLNAPELSSSAKENVLILVNAVSTGVSQAVVIERSRRDSVRLMSVDGLTNILNRMGYLAREHSSFTDSERAGMPFSIVMIDIDKFKLVNDTRGHACGDYVLQRFAKIINDFLSHPDYEGVSFGRIGGEEFCLALPNFDLTRASILANALREVVANASFEYDEDKFCITVSMGLSESMRGETPDDTRKKADMALYQSKKSGRNALTSWQQLSGGAFTLEPVNVALTDAEVMREISGRG